MPEASPIFFLALFTFVSAIGIATFELVAARHALERGERSALSRR